MCSLKAFSSRFVAVAPSVGLCAALAFVAGCQGPDEFFRFSDASQTGTAGTSAAGVAGTTGTAGAPTGTAGTGGGPTGVAGKGGTSAVGASGTSGGGGVILTGTAGTGSGTAGTTGAGGAAGSVTGRGGTTGGRGGTTGSAGTTGTGGVTGAAGAAGGRGGTTGTGGSIGGSSGTAGSSGGRGGGSSGGRGGGAAGTTGTGGGAAGAGGRGPDRIEVVAQCQGTMGMQDIRVTFRILNPESVAKQWSDIKVRYYFTPTAQIAPNVVFDFIQTMSLRGELTTTATTEYVEIGFTTAAGMVTAFNTVTGSDEIQLHLSNYMTPTWNSSQDDDYSYKSCAGVANTSAYTARPTMPGYYQGQLAWGTEPAAP
jgi:cellulose binding protein with CBM3 domain